MLPAPTMHAHLNWSAIAESASITASPYQLPPGKRRNRKGRIAKRRTSGFATNRDLKEQVGFQRELIMIGSLKMAKCSFCAEEVTSIPTNTTDSFACSHCGRQLQATLRCRNFFLAIGAAVAVVLRLATLIFNPRMNPQKTSQFPFVVESLLIRLCWKTKLIRIVAYHPQDAIANPASSARMT
jgi:hypothetical protein